MDEKRHDESKLSLYFLINNLDLKIQFFLLSIGIFNESDLDHIKSGTTQQEQRLILLNVLQGRQYEEAHLFNALEHCKQLYLLDKLQASLSTLKNNQILHRKIARELKDPDIELDASKISKLWEVPQRNPYFTGRSSLLEQVSACFASNEQPQLERGSQKEPSQSHVTVISACQGMGGVGKTQLAIEFVHRCNNVYPYVFWLRAESPSQIEISYQKLAYDLKMDTEQPIDAIVREIKAWFHRNPGCLLVYDNASDPEAIKDYLPLTGCHIIITSRNTEWHWLSNTINITVDVFTITEAREYFQKLLSDQLDLAEVDALSELLKYLPLALAQAGAFIKNNKMTIPQYIKIYKQQKEKLLAYKSLPKFHHEPVFVTWDITMQVIQKKSSLAIHLIKVLSFLHSDDIPDFLIQPLEYFTENNPRSEIYEAARGLLDTYSMIRVNSHKNCLSIHQIVQEVVQMHLDQENKQTLSLQVFNLVLKMYPRSRSLSDCKQKTSLILHMETLLRYFENILKKELINETIIKTALLANLADAYNVLGNYSKRRDNLESALLIKQLHYGPNHPQIAKTLTDLGNAIGDLGDYTTKREHLERSLKIFQSNYDPDHPEIARTLGNLGVVFGSLGDYTRQREYLEQALKIKQLHYGPDHLQAAAIIANLGTAYGNLGDYQKQKEYCEQALKIFELHYGPDHPEVGRTLGNLSNVYERLGDHTKQKEYLERALKIFELNYGPDHSQVAVILTNLASAYGSLLDNAKQREYSERALEIIELHYGPEHPQAAAVLTNLGTVYGNLGDFIRQREYLDRTLKIDESHYGPNHPEVAITLCNIANACGDMGDYGAKRELLERALKIQESHYGCEHSEVAKTICNLGNAYGNLGDNTTQREYLERGLKIIESYYGSDHPEVAITLGNLGNAYGSLTDYIKQREYYERAIKIFESRYSPDYFQVAVILDNLGTAYGNMGDYTKQKECLERALKVFQLNYDPDHPEIGRTLCNLGEAYGSLGDYTKQRDYLERALKIFELHSGPEHLKVAAISLNLGNAHGQLGDHTKQREYLERALKSNLLHYGSDHPDVAITMFNLGNAYGSLGYYAEQSKYLEQALKVFENHYGPSHPYVQKTLNGLIDAFSNSSDFVKLREVIERASMYNEEGSVLNGSNLMEIKGILSNVFDNSNSSAGFEDSSLVAEQRDSESIETSQVQFQLLSTELDDTSTDEVVACCIVKFIEEHDSHETLAESIVMAVRCLEVYNKFGGVLYCFVGHQDINFTPWKEDGSSLKILLLETELIISLWVCFPAFISNKPYALQVNELIKQSDIDTSTFFELIFNIGGTWILVHSEASAGWSLAYEDKASVNQYKIELNNGDIMTVYQCCRYDGLIIDINELDADDDSLQTAIMTLIDETNYDILAKNIVNSVSVVETYNDIKCRLRCIVTAGYTEYIGACTGTKMFSMQVGKTYVTILIENGEVSKGTIDKELVNEFVTKFWLNANHSNDNAFGEFLMEMESRFPEYKWSLALVHGSSDKFAVTTTAESDVDYFVAKFANKETVIIWPTSI